MSSPEKATTQMSSPYWDCCKEEETHAVMEVPGGRYLLQRARGRAVIPSSIPSAWPRHSFLQEGGSLPVSAFCCSPQISPKPPKQAATGWSGSSGHLCRTGGFGKKTRNTILGLISAALGEPGGCRMLQESCTPGCTALPSRCTQPGESHPPAPHGGMQLTRRT